MCVFDILCANRSRGLMKQSNPKDLINVQKDLIYGMAKMLF